MRRMARLLLALGLLALVPLAAYEGAYFLARSEACAELPREDLSLQEMGQLRRALDRYKRDPTVPMRLTPRQASFLLREEFKLLAWVTMAGDQVRLEARLPEPDGTCWNIDFRGRVDVEQGVAHVVPTDLSVGRLAFGWIVGGRSFDLTPADLSEPRAAELLGHIASLDVDGGWFAVHVDDPKWIR